MDEYKTKQKQYRRTLTLRERYLTHHENPALFILFSWRFYYYEKVAKPFFQRLTKRGK